MALIGVSAILVFRQAAADPSDDLAGTPGAIDGAAPADKDSDFDNLEVVDPFLANRIALLRIGSQRGPTGLLGVFAGLKNKTAHRLEIEIETIYKDQSGNELNTGSWIHLTLPPNAVQDYRSSAISAAAVDFLIRVRRARPAQ